MIFVFIVIFQVEGEMEEDHINPVAVLQSTLYVVSTQVPFQYNISDYLYLF